MSQKIRPLGRDMFGHLLSATSVQPRRLVILAGPPGSTKTTTTPALADKLNLFGLAIPPLQWISVDNNLFGPSEFARVEAAKMAGLVADSPEFARGFNFPAQVDMQARWRMFLDSRFDVLGQGPFEKLYAEIPNRGTLLDVLREDFAPHIVNVVYLLAEGADDEVDSWIRDRLIARGVGDEPYHEAFRILDKPKIDNPHFYSERRAWCVESAERFALPIVWFGQQDSPEEIAARVFDVIVALHR